MLNRSDNFKEEYCAQIVKVGQLIPIEGSDFLVRTVINGFNIVVGKDDVKEGDIMVYTKLETSINHRFLSVNNQFEIGEKELNSNYKDVQYLIDNDRYDEAKALVGYFNKHGRVRLIRLRKCPSEGCLFTLDSLFKWKPELKDYDFNQCFMPNEDGIIEPFSFDTVGNDLFVKAYVPHISNNGNTNRGKNKGKNKILRFNPMIDGQFRLHYDTNQLADNMWRFNPDSVVTISNKCHGTSHIVGRVLIKKKMTVSLPKRIKLKELKRKYNSIVNSEQRFYWQRKKIDSGLNSIKRYLENNFNGGNTIDSVKSYINAPYTVDYGNVTSSRKVIKNRNINPAVGQGFYDVDIWTYYGDLLYPYLIDGMIVYSEIVGYVTGCSKGIQTDRKTGKVYDYGCDNGCNKIMPYRITINNDDGTITEWNVTEVYGWTLGLIKNHPELKDYIKPIDIIYHGRFGDLYPNISKDQHWNENVLSAIRQDTNRFHMEMDDPTCKNSVATEGIVVRLDDDIRSEAFKLKSYTFLERESKSIDKGYVDAEMMEEYGE